MRSTMLFILALVLAAGCYETRRTSRDGAVPRVDAGTAGDGGLDDGAPALDGGAQGDAGTCGDGVREGLEACDGSDLGGASCGSLGLGAGVLGCDGCELDASGCSSCAPRCEGRECGSDGCGGSCGGCEPTETCSAGGQCLCTPLCTGRECGDDGCGASCGSCDLGETCEGGGCVAAPDGALMLTEIFYDAVGADDQLEWVELRNASTRSIDLSGYSVGAGGADYTYSVYQLEGTIPAGGCRVVGGPLSSTANGSPTFGQPLDFFPDMQNSGTPGDGVALFAVPAASITASTVPIDAVIYGPDNLNGLLDESGGPGAVDVADVDEGGSIQRTASGWRTQPFPDPNDCGL